MIIVEMQKHFQLRAIEWWSAGMMSSWGLMVLVNPNMFIENPASHSMLNFAPQHIWGLVALLAGCLRLAALFINGIWHRTPAIRWVCTMISILVWFSITAAYASSPIMNMAVIIYGWNIIADMYSAHRSAMDFVEAETQRRIKNLSATPLPDTKDSFSNVRNIVAS